MTDFTTISDTTLAQDKPLTQTIVRALRDNPVAMGEGDPTAPAINARAIEVVAGGVLTYGDYTSQSASSTSDTAVKGVILPYKGSYRVVFNVSGSGSTFFARMYLNGVAIGTELVTTSSAESTQDISGINSGDVLQIRVRAVGAALATCNKFELRLGSGVGFVKTL